MGTWLRVRGQVPIHITPQAWDTFSTEHRWMLNRYIKEDFDFVFEKIKAVIREAFDKFAFGPDTGCILTYNRISDYTYNCGEWTGDLYAEKYDYSDVLLCFNAWDRHICVQEGLQILHLAQKKLFELGIVMPLTWWDSDRLFEEYDEKHGINQFIRLKSHYEHNDRHRFRYVEGMVNRQRLITDGCSGLYYHTFLKVSSDAEDKFVLYNGGQVHVIDVKDDPQWFGRDGEIEQYKQKFEAVKALEVFNRRKPTTRKQKNRRNRRLRDQVGAVAPQPEDNDED